MSEVTTCVPVFWTTRTTSVIRRGRARPDHPTPNQWCVDGRIKRDHDGVIDAAYVETSGVWYQH